VKINESILSFLHQICNQEIDYYVRPSEKKSDEEIESLVKELYRLEGKEIKKIEWLKNRTLLNQKLKNSWVYHYDLNMQWVLFHKFFYENCLKFKEDDGCRYFIEESESTYKKICILKEILDNIDGITELNEEEGTIHLVSLDLDLFKNGIKKFTLS